jgi:hypothetical protein
LFPPIAVCFQLPAMNWTLCSADLCCGVTKVKYGTSEPTDGGGQESYSSMSRLITAVFVMSVLHSDLNAQKPDPALQRISLALERPPLVVRGIDNNDAHRAMDRLILRASLFETLPGRPKLGPLEFVAPQLRGEFVRLALPIGDYLSHGLRTVAAATRRRQNQVARRDVESALTAWRQRTPKS